jgi:hypothetical protein
MKKAIPQKLAIFSAPSNEENETTTDCGPSVYGERVRKPARSF